VFPDAGEGDVLFVLMRRGRKRSLACLVAKSPGCWDEEPSSVRSMTGRARPRRRGICLHRFNGSGRLAGALRRARCSGAQIRSSQFEARLLLFQVGEHLCRLSFVSIMPYFGSHDAIGTSASPLSEKVVLQASNGGVDGLRDMEC
jgi:hypothetical protein